ncbi:hypothetical protein THAOC_36635, partial [Thalassiosira oceanica]
RRHPCHATSARSSKYIARRLEERRAVQATSSSRCKPGEAIDPSRVRFSSTEPAATRSASSGPREPLTSPPSSSATTAIAKCTTSKAPLVAKDSGMARFKRHNLNDFHLEEEVEERRSPQGAKFDRDDSVPKGNTLAGDPQRGGRHSSVADQQASSWSSSRTPFEPHQNLLIEAERQAIILQELARRGIGFPAAVANSHGASSYPTGNDQSYRIQTGDKNEPGHFEVSDSERSSTS